MKLCLSDRTNKKKYMRFSIYYNKAGGGGQNAKKKRMRKTSGNGGTDVTNRTREAYGSMFRVDIDWSYSL